MYGSVLSLFFDFSSGIIVGVGGDNAIWSGFFKEMEGIIFVCLYGEDYLILGECSAGDSAAVIIDVICSGSLGSGVGLDWAT